MKTQLATTVRLPGDLAKRIQGLADDSGVSVNKFMVDALAAYVEAEERKAIDVKFAGMATDLEYQRDSQRLMYDFRHADVEAVRLLD